MGNLKSAWNFSASSLTLAETNDLFAFVGRGLIQASSMCAPSLHYFSYDAGRKVFYDRGGEITLLEPEELTKEGSKALFYKKLGVEGKGNLGRIDLREVRQVLCQ